jgi:hypothetical protein
LRVSWVSDGTLSHAVRERSGRHCACFCSKYILDTGKVSESFCAECQSRVSNANVDKESSAPGIRIISHSKRHNGKTFV